MLRLYYFECIINSMAICLSYEFSPNMMGIQEGYNKNFHEDHWIYEKFDSLHFLRYKYGYIRVMLVSNCCLLRIFALRFVIPKHARMVSRWCYEIGAWFDCLSYEWRSGTSGGLFLPRYPPRGMRSSTLLRGLINSCNKYVSSSWLMWVHELSALLLFRNLLASSVPCIAHSHLKLWCKLR